MPLSYKKQEEISSRDKLLYTINQAAISLIQTNTSRFTEDAIRTRMKRIADDLTIASEEK